MAVAPISSLTKLDTDEIQMEKVFAMGELGGAFHFDRLHYPAFIEPTHSPCHGSRSVGGCEKAAGDRRRDDRGDKRSHSGAHRTPEAVDRQLKDAHR